MHPNGDWQRLYRPRRPRAPGYGTGTYYIVPELGWIGPDDLDYAEPAGYDESAGPQDSNVEEDNGEPALPPWPSLYSSNRPSYHSPQQPSPAPENEEGVTLIFNDGRPSERIYNYALTASTLYVLDKPHRDISVDQINLAATEKVNHEAGVTFQLPQASAH